MGGDDVGSIQSTKAPTEPKDLGLESEVLADVTLLTFIGLF